MAATTSNFPLQCIVCPRKPSFSDVSHLLTHVASKGHLSQYYHLKIRSSNDTNAMGVLESFDSWYVNFNIEQLMSDRMHLKERKRPRLRALANQGPRHRISSRTRQASLSAPIAARLPSAVSNRNIPYQELPTARENKPRLYLWSTARPRTFSPQSVGSSNVTPKASRDAFLAAPMAKMWDIRPMENGMDDGNGDEDDGDDEKLGNEMTKLKGIFWPGMDIFDAATPDMKRKRNQKKHTSVAVQLERHSLLAEPTEMIFTPLGSWRKSRVISGQPDFNSSPDRLSPPVSKPRRRRSNRQPLGQKDANAPLLRSNQRSPSPSPFPGYGRATTNNNDRTSTTFSTKRERDAEAIAAETLQQSTLAAGTRYLTASLHLPQSSGLEARPLPLSTLLDINTGALYHNNFFAETFESHHPTFLGLPYYGVGYYGQTSHLLPGLFAHATATDNHVEHDPVDAYICDHGSDNGECTVSAKSEI